MFLNSNVDRAQMGQGQDAVVINVVPLEEPGSGLVCLLNGYDTIILR